jgi:hypothetical protein
VRFAGTADFSGYFRHVDLEAGRVTLTTPIPESSRRADDPNPRGGLRGAKGVSSYGERLVVANSERIFVFDRGWSIVDELTDPLMGAVHDVLAVEDGIWVTCTACDLLLKIDWHGDPIETWSWRSEPELVSALGFGSLPAVDPELDHRDPRIAQQGVHNIVHLNGVTKIGDGLLLLFGRILSPAVVRQRLRKAVLARTLSRVGVARSLPTKPTPVPASTVAGSSFAVVELPDHGPPRVVLHRSGITVPNHNVEELDGEIVYLDSNEGRLVVWDPKAAAEQLSVPIPGSPSFPRGLVRIGERQYLVGSQAPLALHAVDLDARRVIETIEIEGAAKESVYGLSVVPEAFAAPPAAESLFTFSPAIENAAR